MAKKDRLAAEARRTMIEVIDLGDPADSAWITLALGLRAALRANDGGGCVGRCSDCKGDCGCKQICGGCKSSCVLERGDIASQPAVG